MEYKKHGVAGVEGGPEGQRTQACLFLITFYPKIASVEFIPTCMIGKSGNNVAFILFRPDVL